MAENAYTRMTPDMINHLRPDSFRPFELTDALEYRDLGISKLSGGAITMGVFRAAPDAGGTGWHVHDLQFHLAYVLKGWAVFEFEGLGEVRIEEGTALYQLPWNRHREIAQSPDFEILEITLPAEFDTLGFKPDEHTGEDLPMVLNAKARADA